MTPFSILRVLSVLAVALALAACGGDTESSGAAVNSSEAAAAPEAVTIADLAYSPADVQVAAGSSVTWTNDDDAPHTVTFDDDAITDSEELAKGDEFSVTFDEAGTYAYVCAIHPDMKATVTVQ